MRDPFEVDPNDGKVTLYEKSSGKARKMWPVDAREVLAASDYYTPDAPKRIRDATAEDDEAEERRREAKKDMVAITGGNTPIPSDQSSKGTAATREVKKSAVAAETENPHAAPGLARMLNDAKRREEEEKNSENGEGSERKTSGGSQGSGASSKVSKDGTTRADLDNMNKTELVAFAEKNRVNISATTMTSQQIKDEIARKLEL